MKIEGTDSLDVIETIEELAVAWVRALPEPQRLSLAAAATLSTLSRSATRSVSELAASEHVSQPAMTQLVRRLERDGLVERQPHPTDGRVVDVRITSAGRELLDRRRRQRANALADMLSRLGAVEQRALVKALPALNALAVHARGGEGHAEAA